MICSLHYYTVSQCSEKNLQVFCNIPYEHNCIIGLNPRNQLKQDNLKERKRIMVAMATTPILKRRKDLPTWSQQSLMLHQTGFVRLLLPAYTVPWLRRLLVHTVEVGVPTSLSELWSSTLDPIYFSCHLKVLPCKRSHVIVLWITIMLNIQVIMFLNQL